MGLVSNRVKREDIKPGDHIYTYSRAGFTYSDHGIFVGENIVVHFTPDQKGKASSAGISSSSNFPGSPPCPTSPYCGLEQLPGSGVVVSCLDCFLRKGSPYLYKYGVSPSFFLAIVRGGSCTTAAPSDPPEIVIHRAAYLLRNGFGNYCDLLNNCKGFALYCKTGLVVTSDSKPESVRKEGVGSSGQTLLIACVPLSAIMSLPLVLLMPTPVGLGLAAIGMYSITRLSSDIGVHPNAVKVPVEDLAAKLGWDRGEDL